MIAYGHGFEDPGLSELAALISKGFWVKFAIVMGRKINADAKIKDPISIKIPKQERNHTITNTKEGFSQKPPCIHTYSRVFPSKNSSMT